MANSPGNSEPIRCGMCGKPNPPDRATCEFCGARLRPMTAEELGLSPAVPTSPLRWPEERKKPEPTKEPPTENPDDPLAGLREQLADADDATIIGPSASKDRIKRQDLFENIEPDFTIGKPPEPTSPAEEDDDTAVPSDIPDWLREATKPGQTGPLQVPSGDMPDWLMEETRPTVPPEPLSDETFVIPEWLGKSGDELEDTSQSQATRPMPLADGTPEWMRDLDQPDDEAPQAGVPDWLLDDKAAAPQAASIEEDLDWLRSVPAPEEIEEPEELELDVPDWLQSSGEPATSQETPVAEPYEEDLDWMRPTEEAQSEPEAASEGVPDWLAEMGGAQSPPAESEPDESISSEGVPDWLAEMGDTPTTPAESVPASMEDEIGESAPVELSVPDWLSEASKPSTELEDDAPSPLIASGMPDWLIGAMSEPQGQASEAIEEPVAETGSPDWLRPPQDEEVDDETPEPIAEAETPDWLRPPDEIEPAPESPETIETAAEAETPDWLRTPDEPVAEESSTPAEVTPEVPAWLSGLGLEVIEESEETSDAEEAPQPTASEPAPDIEVGVPDWLAEISSQPSEQSVEAETVTFEEELEMPAATEATPEVPEWLAGLGGEPVAPSAEPEIETLTSEAAPEVPAWLAGLGGEPVTPSAEPGAEVPAATEATPEVPEWLAGLGGEPVAPSAEPEIETPMSESAPEVPEWLTGLGGEPLAPSAEPEVEAPAESEAEPEVPEWLAGLGGEPVAPSAEPEAEAPAESEAELEVPEWLAGLGGEPVRPSTELESDTPAFTEAAAEAPDWLSGLGSGAVTPDTAPEVEATPTPQAEETPDWLAGITAEPSAPSSSAPETQPVEDQSEEVPGWLSGIDSQPAAAEDMPDWLSNVTRGAPAPLSSEASPAGAGGTPDWLADLDEVLGMPGASPVPASGMGEDLLGFDDFELQTETQQEALEPDSGNLPEWLRDVAPEATSHDARRLPEMPSDVPAELAGLRFEAISGQQSMEPTTEKVGALKDVTGVIRPEIIFDAQTLQVGKLIDEIVITNDQRKRIDALEALLERQARGVVVTDARTAFPIVRWVIAALLLFVSLGAALMAATGTSFLPEPVANTPHENVVSIINEIQPDRAVFVAFEYEPDTAAEMQPLAVALLDQLAGKGVRVYAISTRPAGPAMVQQSFDAVSAEGAPGNWVNLGYLTGGAQGVSALMKGGSLPGVTSPLAVDYQGQPTDLTASSLVDLNPALLIVISSRWEDLRIWIEQASDIEKIIAATSIGTGPLAYPYKRSGQIEEVLSGVNDAVAYRAAGDGERSEAINAAWNGQALGGLTAALMILGGSIVYGLRALRQQQEQE